MSTEDTTRQAPGESGASDEGLRQERDELYDRLLRLTAEFDNYRKRTDRERREQAEYAAVDLIRDLLPVVDDLERALAVPVDPKAGAEQVATYRQGVELIRRQIAEVLKRRGVETLEVLGQDFDPQWHEAIANDPIDGHREGEITVEVRRGYRIGQRLIRPATVKVAKA
ncbi:MAG: nucleotide exchange factor GrpE [Vicinamibacterales bacterium]